MGLYGGWYMEVVVTWPVVQMPTCDDHAQLQGVDQGPSCLCAEHFRASCTILALWNSLKHMFSATCVHWVLLLGRCRGVDLHFLRGKWPLCRRGLWMLSKHSHCCHYAKALLVLLEWSACCRKGLEMLSQDLTIRCQGGIGCSSSL